MKRYFFLKALLFCVVIFLVDRGIGLWMNHEMKHQKKGNFVETEYKLYNAKPAIVILGTSRALHHYNSAIFEKTLGQKTINFGQDGCDVYFHYNMLKVLLDHDKPQLVILDIKPGEFDNLPNTQTITQLYPMLDKLKVSDEDLKVVSPFEKIKLLSCTYRFNNLIFETLNRSHGKPVDTATINGYEPLPADKKKFTPINYLDTTFFPETFGYFLKIVKLCKDNNVKLVVCTSPFNNNMVNDISLNKTKEVCEQNGIQYLDYTNNKLVAFPHAQFRDAWHLNTIGADIFTADIIKRIK
jgi:hypothetical protein